MCDNLDPLKQPSQNQNQPIVNRVRSVAYGNADPVAHNWQEIGIQTSLQQTELNFYAVCFESLSFSTPFSFLLLAAVVARIRCLYDSLPVRE